jgi:hypothetical protein
LRAIDTEDESGAVDDGDDHIHVRGIHRSLDDFLDVRDLQGLERRRRRRRRQRSAAGTATTARKKQCQRPSRAKSKHRSECESASPFFQQALRTQGPAKFSDFFHRNDSSVGNTAAPRAQRFFNLLKRNSELRRPIRLPLLSVVIPSGK